ncbi:cytochrome c-type biogenesis protein CcmH [Marinomonas agarivorans]|nr:cytochrome c-type biogenesis protein CcmH [Marinomonas agarivorans]
MNRQCIMLCFLMLCSVFSYAETEKVFTFNSQLDEKRYNSMIAELRCPKCQNQNIADSNAEIAIDLRNQVYSMINAGSSDTEILAYMVARYGEFVLYRPQHSASNFILWYGPFIILGIGLVSFALVIFNNARRRQTKREKR